MDVSDVFVELGWWVGDGDERHHDEIWIDFGLVWRCVSHDSVEVVVASFEYTFDSISCPSWCRFVWSEAPLFFLVWFLLKLTWLVSGIVVVMTIPLSQIRGLTYWESNPMSKIQWERWACGNSVWYWFIYSQTKHFIRFTTLHTNVKWHTNQWTQVTI